MHRIQKIFIHSSNSRRQSGSGSSSGSSRAASKSKPRLQRSYAVKNIDYQYSPSEESVHRQSLDLYGNKTSFRIEGTDGELDMICQAFGFSGIEDFAIPVEEYEAMKVRSSSSAVRQDFGFGCSNVVEFACSDDDNSANGIMRDIEVSNDCCSSNSRVVDVISRKTENNGVNCNVIDYSVGRISDLSGKEHEDSCDLAFSSVYMRSGNSSNCCTNGAGIDVDARVCAFSNALENSINVGDGILHSARFGEYRGNGIKGVRPPALVTQYPLPFPIVGDECLVGDDLKGFTPDSDERRVFWSEEDMEGNEEGYGRKIGESHDMRRRRMIREENNVLSESCSFTSTSVDDDSSSSTTEPMSNNSPNFGVRRIIVEWQKGELLGRGSFGAVYEGIADGGFFFAVKEVSLLDQGEEGKQSVIQLEQEIALLSQFEHENIVQYYGTEKDESHLYIFLELVTKGSLLNLYQRYNLRDSQVSAYTRQILRGLKYLHDRNVVHRDIKCANILVDASGLVKLTDFGLAKATKLNDVRSCKGTAFWMAPEVVRSKGYGLAADIWSLGCTVLEMLTRRFPYSNMECMAALFRIGRGELPPVPDSLSSDARDFIQKCLQVEPNARPTAAELLEHPFVKRPLPTFSGSASPHRFLRQI